MNIDTDLLNLCEKITIASFNAIKDIVGTQEANKTLYIGADGTPTKLIDDISESAILKELISTGINLRIISEEIGEKIIGNNPKISLIMDPVDGTYNAAMGIPFYSISIAIADFNLNEIYFGYVHDLANGDTYYAQKFKGAYLNGKKISVSNKTSLKNICACAYGYPTFKDIDLSQRIRRLRIFGCISLELCYVACGKLDAFIDVRGSVRLTDVAAGKLILEEACGCVTDNEGKKLILKDSIINHVCMIATNGIIHDAILNHFREQ